MPQDRRHHGFHDILRHADAYRPFELRGCHHAPKLIIHGDQSFSARQEPFTHWGQHHFLAFAVKEFLLELIFQPLDLLADCCLGQI